MALIDETYFFGELTIAQLSQAEVEANLVDFITKYEKAYLVALLGETLAKDFTDGLSVLPTPDQIWIDLKAKIVDETIKQSPIANYVYYWYMEDLEIQTVGIGQMRPVAENGMMVSTTHKRMRAWNEMAKMNVVIGKWISDNIAEYPNYDPTSANFWWLDNVYCFKNSFGL